MSSVTTFGDSERVGSGDRCLGLTVLDGPKSGMQSMHMVRCDLTV